MSKQILFMETTKIPSDKTAGEIMSALRQAGSSEILTQCEKGRVTGLKFSLEVNKRIVIFVLPARIDPVFRIINGRRKRLHERERKAPGDREQAERVAWRQLYRWILAQVALIQTGMVEAGEVFLPYMQAKDGKTFWEYALTGGQLALPPGPEDQGNIKTFPVMK